MDDVRRRFLLAVIDIYEVVTYDAPKDGVMTPEHTKRFFGAAKTIREAASLSELQYQTQFSIDIRMDVKEYVNYCNEFLNIVRSETQSVTRVEHLAKIFLSAAANADLVLEDE